MKLKVRYARNCLILAGTTILLMLGCSKGPRVTFKRQTVDESGAPLAGVIVKLSAMGHPHGLRATLGLSDEKTYNLVATNGMFRIDVSGTVIHWKVQKPGYITRSFLLDTRLIAPNSIPATGEVVLVKAASRDVPRDDLDKMDEQQTPVQFGLGSDSTDVAVSAVDPEFATGLEAHFKISRDPNGLRLQCAPSVRIRGLHFDPLENIESWKQSHAVASGPWAEAADFPTESYRSAPAAGMPVAAFFLEHSSGNAPYFYIRAYLVRGSRNDYELYYDLSRDSFFVIQ